MSAHNVRYPAFDLIFDLRCTCDCNEPVWVLKTVIPPEAGVAYVHALPVSRFHGVGPATAAKMERLGLRTGADLLGWDEARLTQAFGKSGRRYWLIARGLDYREVQPHRVRKSLGAENTFSTDIHDMAEAAEALVPLAAKVWRYAEARALHGRTVTLKAKYADFRIVTRARSRSCPVGSEAELLAEGRSLLPEVLPDPRGVRLLGVTLSGFQNESAQLRLFD